MIPSTSRHQAALLARIADSQQANEDFDFSFLDPKFIHRLDAYQASFAGRTISNLARTVLEPCVARYGEQVVTETLARYWFLREDRSHIDILQTLIGFADFLWDSQDIYRQEFSQLARCCLVNWHVLFGPDPAEFGQRQLRISSRLVEARPGIDTYRLWEEANNMASTHETVDVWDVQSTGVLFLKIDVDTVGAIAVPCSIHAFASQVVAAQGRASDILDRMSEEELEQIHDQDLEVFVRSVGSQGYEIG